jgi:hypothetical protein
MSMAASAALGVLVLGHDTRPGLTVCDLDWTREAALLPRTVLQDHFVQHSQCESGYIQVRFLQQDPSNMLVVAFTSAGGRFSVQLVDVVTTTCLLQRESRCCTRALHKATNHGHSGVIVT